MIEAYAFLAAFAVQILASSVLYPAGFIRYVRSQRASLPVERLAQLYPGVDLADAQERFLTRYRVLNTGIAVLGLFLLAWLFGYMRRPDWDDGRVSVLVTAYFLVAHVVPLGLVVWLGVRFNREYKRSLPPEGKRTATLQRRGLFDFVSPFAVALAVLSYFLFAAFVLYLRQQPFPGFAALITLGGVTLAYALNAFVVYVMLYGKNRNPLVTHDNRLHAMSVTAKSSVYSCIVIVVYLSLNLSLRLLDLQSWQPFALSVFFILCTLLTSLGVIARPNPPNAQRPVLRGAATNLEAK